MLRKFSVRNFRCLQNLDIEPLARVNLIVGENNVGKTALLEALNIHCAPNSPERVFGVNFFRGAGGNNAEHWNELSWLFHARQTSTDITLQSDHGGSGEGALRIRFVQPEERSLLPADANGALKTELHLGAANASSNELILEYMDSEGKEYTSHARLTPQETLSSSANVDPFEIKFSSSSIDPYGPAILVPKYPRFPEVYAEQYSALVEAGREAEVLPPLQALDPRIQRLELLYRLNRPVFYADTGNVPLMPLLHMGEGIAHVLSWLLAIKTIKNGTILIDEFENGLYYTALVDVWKAISAAARESNLQVFATTHSWECVLAAHRAFVESNEYDFRLHRLERRDGKVIALTYDEEQLATSIHANLEVR
ncbi:MAG: AAA family ATPase [Chloroflexi bacterium]|nr:AAA family ATPase [Chloroflexota bacterium]